MAEQADNQGEAGKPGDIMLVPHAVVLAPMAVKETEVINASDQFGVLPQVAPALVVPR